MNAETLVALAALGGALIGGLTTVGATFLTNHGTAARERDQRRREASYSEYEDMKALLSEFLGEWMQLYSLESKDKKADSEHTRKLNILRARLLILAPGMRTSVDTMRGVSSAPETYKYSEALRSYEKDAKDFLAQIRPEPPKKKKRKVPRGS